MSLSLEALQRLEQHPWPGDIRELGNVIERLVLLTDHSGVSARELERFLPPELVVSVPVPAASPLAMPPAYETPPVLAAQPAPLVCGYLGVGSHSAAQLQQALAAHGGN